MTRNICRTFLAIAIAGAAAARAAEFQLLTGVDAGLTPGSPRAVFPTGAGPPNTFVDGDRLAGTPGVAPATYAGTGAAWIAPNAYGALSFLFRRGSLPIPGIGQQPILAVDYLGGPLLDLDGDLGNGSRRLTPVIGQSPAEIPGSRSRLGLNFDFNSGTIGLDRLDATATNQGFQGFGPNIALTVNTLSGTLPDGTDGGASINPGIDTRVGALAALSPNVFAISNLGYEFWQDSVDPTSSTAGTLGTFQYLGALRGFLVTRDGSGQFPTLTGMGLGSTLWPMVNTSMVGAVIAQSSGAPPIVTVTTGPAADLFTAPGNGGLALTAPGGDIGAYLDTVVAPLVDPLSNSFVYLESAGVGANNSFDPIFGDTMGYDVVLIAQSAPIPEPATGGLLILSAAGLARRPRRR